MMTIIFIAQAVTLSLAGFAVGVAAVRRQRFLRHQERQWEWDQAVLATAATIVEEANGRLQAAGEPHFGALPLTAVAEETGELPVTEHEDWDFPFWR